jgi:gamma-glutamylcyclotransferase
VKTVFAYGSNMCSARVRDYGISPSSGTAALLNDHALLFDKRSMDGSGKANVVAGLKSQVWGVLYSLSDDDFALLSKGEKGYIPYRAVVVTSGSCSRQAHVYRADEAYRVSGLRPFHWYKQFIVQGAKEHALPDGYVALLEAAESIPDPDQDRDARKRLLLRS